MTIISVNVVYWSLLGKTDEINTRKGMEFFK